MLMRLAKFGFFLILIFSLNIVIIAKEDKNGEDKKKDARNNSQRNISNKNQIQNNIEKEIIKNRRNDVKKDNFMRHDRERSHVDFIRENIIEGIDNTESIKNELRLFQRNINQSSGDFNNIQNQYGEITKEIENLNNRNMLFLSNLDKIQKDEVKYQLEVIEESEKGIADLISRIEKDFKSQKKDKRSISIKFKELEKEINKINKQYRAIEWLLYEQ